ncbi:MAG: DUF928 domain-containing protein [Mastigocoleus sp. MO_167.B18]|nr:DUF928 domain-containing protein [Mastigocoleus sp. MO_167.B18]
MKKQVFIGTLSICTFLTSFIWIYSKSAHAVIFQPPPDEGTPRETKGGASRRDVKFVPPPQRQTPSRTSSGGSRGSLFAPKRENGTPKSRTEGVSRGNLFTPKPGNETPKSGTAGGGSRSGETSSSSQNINPQSSVISPRKILPLLPQTFFGTTVSERPNIFVYLPESTAQEAIFSFKNAAGKTLHHVKIPVSGKAEVLAIKIPTSLELEQNYKWFLALKVNNQLTPRTPYVNGWIKRIQPNSELLQAIENEDGLKQAKAFGKHGIWYDCIETLAKLRVQKPNDKILDKHWSELLGSVELKDIDKAPIVALNN